MNKLIRVAAVTLFATASTLLLASPAPADALDLVCGPPSSNITTYEPPLTNTPQDITVTSNTQFGPLRLRNCAGTDIG